MKKLLLISIISIKAAFAIGQVNSSVKLDTDSLSIGDIVNLYVELKTNTYNSIEMIDYSIFDQMKSLEDIQTQDSLEYFAELEWEDPKNEILKIRSPKLIQYDNHFVFRDTLRFRIWDAGTYRIPHPEIMLRDSLNSIRLLQNPILKVSLPLNIINPDTSAMILPIKDIIVEQKKLSDYLWILYILSAGLVLYIAFLLLKRKKKTITVEQLEEVILPSHIIASRKLTELRVEKEWEKGLIKEFQSKLTYIIREYLENRFRINALESTTDEIKRDLKRTNLDQDQINDLLEILQIADMVKFAKAEPPFDINQVFLNKAQSLVDQTKIALTEEEENRIISDYNNYMIALNKIKNNRS